MFVCIPRRSSLFTSAHRTRSFETATPLPSTSPFSLLFQQVSEVVTFVHVVSMFAFLRVQLVDCATMALLSEQQLAQHPPVRLFVLLLQTFQLKKRQKVHTNITKTKRALNKYIISSIISTDLSHRLLVDTVTVAV